MNKDDVDLNKKLDTWGHFYNFNRPHGALNVKTPYEILKYTLKNNRVVNFYMKYYNDWFIGHDLLNLMFVFNLINPVH